MSMLQRSPASSPGPGGVLFHWLLSLINVANGFLLAVFLIEGLWVYLWMEWLGNWRPIGWDEVPLTLPSILLILWASYHGVQVLGEQLWSGRKVYPVTAVYSVALLAVVARLENGGGYGLFDLSWFSFAGNQLTNSFLSSFQVTLLGGVYLWWRGYRLARSRLQPEQAFHSFMLGLVGIILGLLLRELAFLSSSGGATGQGLAALITASFFFAALSVLALSHIRRIRAEMLRRDEESRLFSQQWPAVLLGIVTSMVLVGWLAALLFSFDIFSPVIYVLSLFGDVLLVGVYYVVFLPLAYIAAGFTYAFVWFIGLFGPATDLEIRLPGQPDIGERLTSEPNGGSPLWLLTLLRWSLVTLAMALLVYFLVRLLLRFRYRPSAEGVVETHESVGTWKDVVRDVLLAFFTLMFWFQDRGRQWRRGVRAQVMGSRRGSGEEAEVRVLYRRLLVEAREAGFPRRLGETPLEYLSTLEHHLPSEQETLERLTQGYTAVRYGEQAISEEEGRLLNRLWRGIYDSIQYYRDKDRPSET